MSLLFNTHSRFVIAFLPGNKRLLISSRLLISVQSLSHVQLFVTPWTEAHQAFTVACELIHTDIVAQGNNIEHIVAAAAAKSPQSCLTLCDPIDGSPRGSRPWDSPGKNTGVGYHFLLQCMKVKSESEVAQSCPTVSDPMDCSLPGSSVHGSFQARVLEWGAIAFSNM